MSEHDTSSLVSRLGMYQLLASDETPLLGTIIHRISLATAHVDNTSCRVASSEIADPKAMRLL